MSFPAGSGLLLAGLPIDQGQPEALQPGPSLGQPVRSGQPGGVRGGRGGRTRWGGADRGPRHVGSRKPLSASLPAGFTPCPARDGGLGRREPAEDSEQQGARHSAASATATETEVCQSSHTRSTEAHLSVCAPADAPPGQQRSDAVL